MFKSLFDLGKDIVDIATAPVEIAADITRAVTKPIADAAKEAVETVKDEVDDLTDQQQKRIDELENFIRSNLYDCPGHARIRAEEILGEAGKALGREEQMMEIIYGFLFALFCLSGIVGAIVCWCEIFKHIREDYKQRGK